MERKHKVFVYGTLLRGEPNHRLLEPAIAEGRARMVARARIVGRFALLDLGPFPGVVEDDSATRRIVGELYEVDDATFKRLDQLEGYPNLYGRREVPVTEHSIRAADLGEAWVYTYNRRPTPWNRREDVVESGDWRAHREELSQLDALGDEDDGFEDDYSDAAREA